MEVLQFPSILFRTQSVIPNENGKFIPSTNIPIIYGTKFKWIILYSNETYLSFFKHLINSTAVSLSLSYLNVINILYRKINDSLNIHAEIIKCNTVDEILIIFDTGNICGLNETITFAKTKNPDAAIFVLKLKDLRKLVNEKLEGMAKFQRMLNIKMGGLNHTPNYSTFLA
uniref:Uncharacterized protein n=1 Tax=Panagrolaimus davidi TaxID=227884 RepID=A0A914QF62_9BILA